MTPQAGFEVPPPDSSSSQAGVLAANWARVCVFLVLVAFSSVVPLQAEIRLDVFPGFDGFVHADQWFPVTVEIENTGETVDGELELQTGAPGNALFRLKESFPKGTRKRFRLSAFADGRNFSGIQVRFLGKPGDIRVEKESSVLTLPPEVPLIGALPATAAGLPRLPGNPNPEDSRLPQVARFDVAQFPTDPIVLEGLNSLYLHSAPLLRMEPGQVHALIGWVRSGGHLVVAAEQATEIRRDSPLAPLLPLAPGETVSVEPGPALMQWVRSTPPAPRLGLAAPAPNDVPSDPGKAAKPGISARPEFRYADIPASGLQIGVGVPGIAGNLTRDAEVLFADRERPLAIARSVDRGRITFLAWNPEREPLRNAPGTGFFWAALMGISPNLLDGRAELSWKRSSFEAVLGAITDTEQIRKLPVGVLLGILLVYILVIGPFDRWLIRRSGRPLLTWITFPAYVLVFSLMIYGIGFQLRSGRTEWNELHVVDLLGPAGGGGTAHWRGRTYGSIYSPANEVYRFAEESGATGFRNRIRAEGLVGTPAPLVVRQEGESRNAEVAVAVWTSRAVVGEWVREAASPLEIRIRVADDGRTLEFANRSGQALQEIWVVLDQQVYGLLSPLAPGSVRSFPLLSGIPLRDFLAEQRSEMEKVLEFRASNFGSMGEPVRFRHPPRTVVAASLVSLIRDSEESTVNSPWKVSSGVGRGTVGQDLGLLATPGRALVFAWQEDVSPFPPLHRFVAPRHRKTTCFRIAVPAIAASRP